MQTFLPYPDFVKSAEVLDYRRLGKQRQEVIVLLGAITVGNGWSKHPAAKMWVGHQNALVLYGFNMCIEWENRGYKNNTCLQTIGEYLSPDQPIVLPSWFGNEDFHRSHRANLTRKDPVFYGKYWQEDPTLPYIWPV